MSTVVAPTSQQLDNLVSPYLQTSAPIAIVVGYASPSFGSGIYYAGSIVDQNGDPMTLNAYTPFELASVTKTFTATLYQSQVQSGAITSAALLSDIFPQGQESVGQQFMDIPLTSLASYSSGLPQDNETDSVDSPSPLPIPYTVEEMFEYLDLTSMQPAAPNTVYAYSNLGFALLAETVVAALGGTSSAADLLSSNLFQPLGLSSTEPYTDSVIPHLPMGFDAQTGNPNNVPPGWPLFPAYLGAGGLVSTPNDLMTWLLFNMGINQNSSLSPLLATTQSPATSVIATSISNSQLGLSWFLTTIDNGQGATLDVAWKDGDLEGFSSYITFLQSSQPGTTASEAGVFILTNSNGDAVYDISNDLLFLMTGNTAAADKTTYPRSRRR